MPFTKITGSLTIKHIVLLSITLFFFIWGIMTLNTWFSLKELASNHQLEDMVHLANLKNRVIMKNINEALLTNGAIPAINAISKSSEELDILIEDIANNIWQEQLSAINEIKAEKVTLNNKLVLFLEEPEEISLDNPNIVIIAGAISAIGDSIQIKLDQLDDNVGQKTHKVQDNIQYSVALSALITVAVSLVIFVFLYKGVVGPMALINKIDAIIKTVKEGGDLSARVEAGAGYEVSQLATDFNDLMGNLNNIIGQASATTKQVAANAGQLAFSIKQTNEGITDQQKGIEQVTMAVRDMTKSVQNVAQNTASAAQAAQEADQEAIGGKNIVSETRNSINLLSTEVQQATEAIHELNEESEVIGSIVGVISGIAEQTNLLALNAAIEAARAGESGRGFAVVADEVRSLASRTQESTQEIGEMINKLRSSVHNAIEIMERGRMQSDLSVEQAEKAGQSLEGIAKAVATITDMNTQIASTIEEQSTVANEIDQNLENIKSVSDLTTNAASIITTTSEELQALANQLHDQINQLNTDDLESAQEENTGASIDDSYELF